MLLTGKLVVSSFVLVYGIVIVYSIGYQNGKMAVTSKIYRKLLKRN